MGEYISSDGEHFSDISNDGVCISDTSGDGERFCDISSDEECISDISSDGERFCDISSDEECISDISSDGERSMASVLILTRNLSINFISDDSRPNKDN